MRGTKQERGRSRYFTEKGGKCLEAGQMLKGGVLIRGSRSPVGSSGKGLFQPGGVHHTKRFPTAGWNIRHKKSRQLFGKK